MRWTLQCDDCDARFRPSECAPVDGASVLDDLDDLHHGEAVVKKRRRGPRLRTVLAVIVCIGVPAAVAVALALHYARP
jgi:hypothetical protein